MAGKTKALTRESAWKAKQMYEEKDERGRRKWTIMQIADYLGVGETTAYRAIKSIGPYQSLPEVPTAAEVQQGEAAAAELFKKNMESGEWSVDESGTVRLKKEVAKAKRSDKLLEELMNKGETVADPVKAKLKDYLG